MSARLSLPVFGIPDLPGREPTRETFLAWLEEGWREIVRSGRLEDFRQDPARRPSPEKFVLKSTSPRENR